MRTYTKEEVERFARAELGCFEGKLRSNIPVIFTKDSSPPKVKGDTWHYETRTGIPINHPGSYSKSGWSSMVYVPSTLRIEVGQYWKPMRIA